MANEEEPLGEVVEKTPRQKITEIVGNAISFIDSPQEVLAELPKTVSVDNIEGLGFDRGEAEYIIRSIYRFIEAPFFTDKFENHKKRIEWENEIKEDLGAESFYYLQRNKLSVGGLNLLLQPLKLLSAKIRGRHFEDSSVQDLAQIALSLHDEMENKISNYDSLTLEEKIKFVQKMEKEAINLLKLLEKKETDETPQL